MDDNEKNRAEYVTRLELTVQNLQRQLAEVKGEERWIPKLGAELNSAEESARITLSFGGKNQTASFSYPFLRDQSLVDATTNILELGFKDFVLAQLRPVIQNEVDRLQKGARSITNAGKC